MAFDLWVSGALLKEARKCVEKVIIIKLRIIVQNGCKHAAEKSRSGAVNFQCDERG